MTQGPAAGWYPDPLARFDHRYWDGAAWTHHVARAGEATTDPLPGSTPEVGSARADADTTGSDATHPTTDTPAEGATTDPAAATPVGATGETAPGNEPQTDPSAGFAAVGSTPSDEPALGATGATDPGGSPGTAQPPTWGAPGGPAAGQTWQTPSPAKTTNVKAVVSLILALVWLGGLGSIAAIVVGVMARRDIDRSEGREGGEGVALAGIIIGALGLLATILIGIAVAAFVDTASSGGFDDVLQEFSADGFDGAEGSLQYTLLDVDFYQEQVLAEKGRYATSPDELEELGWLTADDVTIAVEATGSAWWCVEARSTVDAGVVWHTTRDDDEGPGPGTC